MVILQTASEARTCRWTALAVAAAVFFLAVPARAALIVNVGSVAVSPGTTGDAFDVTLTNTSSTPQTGVGSFAFGLTAASSAITFTQVNTSTASAYIFAGSSFFAPNITNGVSAQSVGALDFTTLGSGITLAGSSTVGLGHVLFNVASGASPGPITVMLSPFPTTNLASASTGNPTIPLTTLNSGTITIQGAAVPAPSSLLMGLSAAAALVAFRWVRSVRGRLSFPSPPALSV